MKKSIRNLVIGAVMAFGVVGASSAALANTQYVQTGMNFRLGPSTTASVIGSVPEGAQVDLLDTQNGWNLINYNGVTGYIHGGNLADSYAPKQNVNYAPSQSSYSTQSYYDNGFAQQANAVANSGNAVHTVYVDGYLALRSAPEFDPSNEIGRLYTGDTVELISTMNTGSYIEVFCPKYGVYGYVNGGFVS